MIIRHKKESLPPWPPAYAKRLADMEIDGLEVSCGTSSLSPWNMCRGDIPVQDILEGIPESRKAKAEESLERMKGRVSLEEGYNLEAAKRMKPMMGRIPLFSVGGWRHVRAMEEALHKGDSDLISLCRPFIREPSLVEKDQGRESGCRLVHQLQQMPHRRGS